MPDPTQLVAEYGSSALHPVWVSLAPRKTWYHWVPVQIWQGHFFRLLSAPFDRPKEELPLFMPGRLARAEHACVVQRVQANVQALSFCVLDYDKGDAHFIALADRIAQLDLCAAVYRSPSDGNETTKIRRTGKAGSAFCEPTVEACRNKLVASGFKSEILGEVEIVDECVHEAGSAWVVVRHNPIAKTRVVIALAEPFTRYAGEASGAFALRWRRDVMEPLAHKIGFAADTSRFDSNGAFYFPRSLPGIVTQFVRGEPLILSSSSFAEWQREWQEPRREADAARRARTAGCPTTLSANGRGAIGASRYALANLIWDCANARVRGGKTNERDGLIECECPFDELHSNAGDESDRAFFVTNSGAAGCLHSHKDEHCTADYIAKMVADGWFSADQLAAYALPPRLPAKKTQKLDLYAVAYGL